MMNILKVKFVLIYNSNTGYDYIFKKIYYELFTK